MPKQTLIFIAILFVLFSTSSIAVDAQKDDEKRDSSETSLPTEFEPSPSHPFGKLNPNAPGETVQFSFMIGEFSCDDKERQRDGTWIESKTIWNSSYFVNGGGIQDRYWSKTVVASGTRIYDKTKEKWIVNYFQTFPVYFAGVWEGLKEGDKMIMRAPRGENESRLTFHNIKDDGFDWIGETVAKDGKATPFWIISCKRKS